MPAIVPALALISLSPGAAIPVVGGVAVGAHMIDRARGNPGASQRLQGRLAKIRVGAFNEETARGPVGVAAALGFAVAGLPGAVVAGLATSVGCAACERFETTREPKCVDE